MDEPQAKKPLNKTEIVATLSEATGLDKQQVAGLFGELAKLIGKNLADEYYANNFLPGGTQRSVPRESIRCATEPSE